MIQPQFNQILIEVEKASDVTVSGIIIPDNSKNRLEKATVISVGPDVESIKEGDIILFKSYATDTIKEGDQELTFIKEEEVLATCTITTTK